MRACRSRRSSSSSAAPAASASTRCTARKVTGLPAFNFSATNARPEAAWAIANWLLARSPRTQLRWVWGVQASTLWDRPLDPGLLQDTRFMSHLPRSLLSGQLQALPAGQPPTTSFLDRRRYSADGMLLWNSYDARRARGLTLEDSLSQYIGKAVARMERVSAAGGVSGRGRSRARAYFEKTLKLLNDHGTTPLIVLMPVHPQVLSVMRAHGWQQSRGKLLDYLLALQGDYSFAILDLTEIASFEGDPAEFYDGVHMTKENADRAIEQMARSAGSELESVAASLDRPRPAAGPSDGVVDGLDAQRLVAGRTFPHDDVAGAGAGERLGERRHVAVLAVLRVRLVLADDAEGSAFAVRLPAVTAAPNATSSRGCAAGSTSWALASRAST